MNRSGRKRVGLGLAATLGVAGVLGVTSITSAVGGADDGPTLPTITIDLEERSGKITYQPVEGDAVVQTIATGEPCAKISTSGEELLVLTPTASSNPSVQLPRGGLGVESGSNCGNQAAFVSNNQTLTVGLGSYFTDGDGFTTSVVGADLEILRNGGSSLKVTTSRGETKTFPSSTNAFTAIFEPANPFTSITLAPQGGNPAPQRGVSLTGAVFTLEAPVVVTVPGAPTAVTGIAGNEQVDVSWTAPGDDGGSAITDYIVEYRVGDTGDDWEAFDDGESTTTSATVTGLTNGTAYTFRVAAVNEEGDGPFSAPSEPVTPATVPDAPTAVTGVAGNGQVVVSWEAPDNTGGSAITDYIVQYRTGNTGDDWTPFADGVPTTTSATVTGLTNGTAYTFRVAAVNAVGTGDFSDPSAPVTPVGDPGAPTAVTGVAGNGQVVVSWTAPVDDGGSAITDYIVQYRTGDTGDDWTLFADGVSTTTSATVTGLTNGTAYTFRVAAVNAVGTGDFSDPSAPVTPRPSADITGEVDCGESLSVADEIDDVDLIAGTGTFTRLQNGTGKGDDACELITVRISITEGFVFWDNDESPTQDVQALFTIEWAGVPASGYETPVRLINYEGDEFGDVSVVEWCVDFDGTTATLPEDVPWCLVSNFEEVRDGLVFRTDVMFGGGDPLRFS